MEGRDAVAPVAVQLGGVRLVAAVRIVPRGLERGFPVDRVVVEDRGVANRVPEGEGELLGVGNVPVDLAHKVLLPGMAYRSEEHTSELQSLRHLVCRLLLEKKRR